MLKNAYFLEKTVKNRLSVGAPPPNPRLLPESVPVVTSAYYYSFVDFVLSLKCVLLPSKNNKITTVNVLFLLLSHFCTYFSL